MVEWERLSAHLAAVGDRASSFAAPFGWAEAARVAGRLHDIGKCSAEFQAYIRGERTSGDDHSTAGAREGLKLYPGALGRLLAFIIAGHHAGLADGAELPDRLAGDIPSFLGWEADAGALPPLRALAPAQRSVGSREKGFSEAFLIRMLFSCLVDADFLETERFYAEAENRAAERGDHTPLPRLRDRLRAHMAAKRADAETDAPGPLNDLRAEILDHAVRKAALPPGLFTLAVPTGGGKTLASLSFALEHAIRHALERVVYVIPFTGARIETQNGGPT